MCVSCPQPYIICFILLSLRFNGHFPGAPGSAGFIEAKEVVVTTGAIRHAKLSQIITINKPTSDILQDACPSCRPTNSVRALKAKYHIPRSCSPQTHLGVFRLCLWPLKAPCYFGVGLPCLSSALWCQYPMFHTPMARYSLFVLKGYKVNFPGMHREQVTLCPLQTMTGMTMLRVVAELWSLSWHCWRWPNQTSVWVL